MKTLKYSPLILVLLASAAFAAPNLMRFQGRLTNSEGRPIPGQPQVKFAIYDAPVGGGEKWGPTPYMIVNSNDHGLFSTNLNVPPSVFNTSDPLYLEVVVYAGGGDHPMLPRQQLTSVPFAFSAVTADRANEADNVADGSITSDKLATGAVMRSKIADNAVGALQIEDGSISFLDIAPDSIRTEHIRNGDVEFVDLATDAVTSDNIQDGSIQESDMGIDSVSGLAIKNGTITEEDLELESVTSEIIKYQTIATADIEPKAITPETIADGYGLVPSGAVLMFNRACPAEGWSYLADMNGHVPIGIDPGSFTGNQAGSWNISGLTTQQGGNHNHIVNSHTHDMSGHTHLVPRELAQIATGAFGTTQPPVTSDPRNDTTYPSHGPSINTSGASSPITDSHAGHSHGVASAGTWRPAHIGLVFCVKN